VKGGEVGGVVGGEVGGVKGGEIGGVKGGELGGVLGGKVGGTGTGTEGDGSGGKEAPVAMPTGPVRVGGDVKAPIIRNKSIAQIASSNPAVPPKIDTNTLSVSNC